MKHVPCLGYDDFISLIDKELDRRRIPLGGGAELTERCNLNCVHCCINRPASDREAKKRELTTSEWFKVIDDAARRECLWFQLTGGEPLLRPDFIDIYLHAKKKGMFVSVYTNATLIDEKMADLFAVYPPRRTEISVYGATKETYERVTRVAGSFERCMKGIDLLSERGVPLKIKTMAMSVNRHEIGRLKEFADSLGAEFQFDPLITSRYDGGRGPTEVCLSPEEIVELDKADPERKAAWEKLCQGKIGPPPEGLLYPCEMGRFSFHVDAHGFLMPCLSLRTVRYDLKKGSFDDGFNNFFAEVLKERETKRTKCSSCDLRILCYQCPAWSQTENGDNETPVEYLCEVAKARKDAFSMRGE